MAYIIKIRENILREIDSKLAKAKTVDELYSLIVNAPFLYKPEMANLFLGIIVVLKYNLKSGKIERKALSSTEFADNTVKVSKLPFSSIEIPIDDKENVIAKTIKSGRVSHTTDWKYLFHPIMDEKSARINQASGGIATSFVYPLTTTPKHALIFSFYQYIQDIEKPHKAFMKEYSAIVTKHLDNFS